MIPGNEGKLEVSMGGVVLLGGTTVLVTAVAFLLGIYVGKGITEERLASEQQVVKLPVESPEPPESDESREVSFWDRLDESGKAKPTAAPEGEATAEPTESPAATPTATSPPRPTPTAEPILTGGFRVQVQALSDRRAAEQIAQDLRAAGYLATISVADVEGKRLYRVRVGPYSTEEQARTVIRKLSGLGFPGAFLAR